MSLPWQPRFVAVIDIGKSNAKLALVDLDKRSELTALRQPNTPLSGPPYPHHDVDSLGDFIIEGLAKLCRENRVDAISVTTHGATAVLLGTDGQLVLPVLDYEFAIPDNVHGHYDALRPDFAETGSPKLPFGLNLGAQLYWLRDRFPSRFARTAAILTYPQYWSWRLSGVMASEATSLGCHTDLWNPRARGFSTLVDIMDLQPLLPPLRPADAVLGPVLPGIAARTGLDPRTPVISGIHDSNASLLPHLVDRKPPFAVVSTGTWVVAMAIGGRAVALDPARDTLMNVNAVGDPVPSARFMGGREFELLMDGHPRQADETDLAAVLETQAMLLPSRVVGAGPFPDRQARWIGDEPEGGRRHAAVSFYLAMMTATCLDLVGAEGEVVIEGPFARNELYLTMLEAATERPVGAGMRGSTGTSIGAALLANQSRLLECTAPREGGSIHRTFTRYAAAWRARLAGAD